MQELTEAQKAEKRRQAWMGDKSKKPVGQGTSNIAAGLRKNQAAQAAADKKKDMQKPKTPSNPKTLKELMAQMPNATPQQIEARAKRLGLMPK